MKGISVYILIMLMGIFSYLSAQNDNVRAGNGRELSLDGQTGHMMIPDNSSLDFDGSFTIEFWFRSHKLNQWQRLIGKGSVHDTTVSNWSITLMSDNTIDFFWESADDTDHFISSPDSITDLDFHHIAAVLDTDANLFHLYIDGALSKSRSTMGDSPGSNEQPLLIGARQYPSGINKFFEGEMDEIRIWNVARTEDQINERQFGILPPVYYQSADSGLVGYWRCDSLESYGINGAGQDDVRDYSIYNNHSDLEGDATLINSGSPVAIADDARQLPSAFMLAQNYPNPFNPSTTIRYQLPKNVQVSLKVYDMLGQEIETLINRFQQAGDYEQTFQAGNLSSGIYFYSLTADNFQSVKKMVLIR